VEQDGRDNSKCNVQDGSGHARCSEHNVAVENTARHEKRERDETRAKIETPIGEHAGSSYAGQQTDQDQTGPAIVINAPGRALLATSGRTKRTTPPKPRAIASTAKRPELISANTLALFRVTMTSFALTTAPAGGSSFTRAARPCAEANSREVYR